jgi:hypothetical protein
MIFLKIDVKTGMQGRGIASEMKGCMQAVPALFPLDEFCKDMGVVQ